MNFESVRRRALAPVAIVGVLGIAGATASGCGEDGIGGITDALCCEDFKPGTNMVTVDWGLEGQANVQFGVFLQAVGDLSVSAAGVISAVGVECEAMVREMGEPAPTLTTEQANDPAEHARQWCGVAFSAIGRIKGEASLTIDFQPPSCEVEASAQANCEASCSADVSCEAELGDISARCEPGKLSGKCTAECTGSCEGSATVAVECQGTCSGTCRGECSADCEATVQGGAANGDCAGKCGGTCSGKCEGSCEIEAGAEIQCDGTCKGECSVEFQAPKCEAELTPPSAECQGSAECSGGCDASASAKAECHPPEVTIVADGNVSAELEAKITTIRLHLPNLLAQLVGKAELLVGNVTAVADAAVAISGSGELNATAALCIIPAISAMEDATVNVTASVDLAGQLTGSL